MPPPIKKDAVIKKMPSMEKILFRCSECGKEYAAETANFCCSCSGLFDLDYSPPPYSPDLIDKKEWSIFRYRAFLPVTNNLWKDVSMGEGLTPVAALSENLLVKVDYAMPTLSFKDRGAALVIWLAKTLGVKKVIQDSSGNAGNSIAAYAARAGMECVIYVPDGTSPAKIKMIESYGAEVKVLPLSRDETALECRKAASAGDGYYASHVFNPLFYQGTKTFVYELLEQMGRLPDNLFIPVGNGTLLIGIMLALEELLSSGVIARRPKIYAVQSERCAPLLNAFSAQNDAPGTLTAGVNAAAGAATGVENAVASAGKVAVAIGQPAQSTQKTLAEGIAVGQPARGAQILRSAYKAGIKFIPAREGRILEARKILAQRGFYVEHTTAATYAAYLSFTENYKIEGDALIPLCGAGLKSDK